MSQQASTMTKVCTLHSYLPPSILLCSFSVTFSDTSNNLLMRLIRKARYVCTENLQVMMPWLLQGCLECPPPRGDPQIGSGHAHKRGLGSHLGYSDASLVIILQLLP